MLEVSGLSVRYGLHAALADVALNVGAGEIVAILGANGAGKTTLLKAIGGLVPALPGARVALAGRDLTAMPPHDIVEAGVALVPEGRSLFGELTVAENLLLGAYARRARETEAANRTRVLALFPRLSERLAQTARTLSGGEQQMLAIGRGLMSAPDILLLDEPSLGLSPLLVETMFALIERISRDGLAILLVEQNVVQSLAIARRAYVLEHGVIALAGTAAELADNPDLRRSYLGV
jgi:branched-chain amino acid transport system ATP-binding protein